MSPTAEDRMTSVAKSAIGCALILVVALMLVAGFWLLIPAARIRAALPDGPALAISIVSTEATVIRGALPECPAASPSELKF